MNSTANASSEFWNCATLFSSKAFIGGTVSCLVSDHCCFTGWKFPTYQIQVVSLLYSRHLDSCSSCQFVLLVRRETGWKLRKNAVWSKRRMEGSIRRVLVLFRLRNSDLYLVYLHPCTVVSHSLLHHPYQTQDTGTPRWTFVPGQRWTITAKKKQKRALYVHCYHFSVCVLLVTIHN